MDTEGPKLLQCWNCACNTPFISSSITVAMGPTLLDTFPMVPHSSGQHVVKKASLVGAPPAQAPTGARLKGAAAGLGLPVLPVNADQGGPADQVPAKSLLTFRIPLETLTARMRDDASVDETLAMSLLAPPLLVTVCMCICVYVRACVCVCVCMCVCVSVCQ